MSPLALVPRLPPVPTDVSDAELVERIRAKDKRAEELLYRRYVGYVHALCLRLLAHPHEADDATQDTFLAALEDLPTLRQTERLKPWLSRIAVNKAHRRFRRRRLLRALGMLHDEPVDINLLPAAPGSSPEEALELRKLSVALSRMADADRAPWLLRYVEGHQLHDVASMCGCSLATAKRRIARAHAVVEEHVKWLEEGP